MKAFKFSRCNEVRIALGILVFLGLGLPKFQPVLPFALICLLRATWKLIEGFALVGPSLAVLSVPDLAEPWNWERYQIPWPAEGSR